MRKIGFLKFLLAAIVFSGIFKSALAQQKSGTVINHIAIHVVDLKKSTTFYKDVLGLEMIPEPFNDGIHTWFSMGNHSQLHLIEGAKKIKKHDKNSHLCFSVASVDDFIEKLNRFKIDFTNWKGEGRVPTLRVDGVKQIYFKDPDGYWIEVNDDHH
jgi:lactoylglutathione lyase